MPKRIGTRGGALLLGGPPGRRLSSSLKPQEWCVPLIRALPPNTRHSKIPPRLGNSANYTSSTQTNVRTHRSDGCASQPRQPTSPASRAPTFRIGAGRQQHRVHIQGANSPSTGRTRHRRARASITSAETLPSAISPLLKTSIGAPVSIVCRHFRQFFLIPRPSGASAPPDSVGTPAARGPTAGPAHTHTENKRGAGSPLRAW